MKKLIVVLMLVTSAVNAIDYNDPSYMRKPYDGCYNCNGIEKFFMRYKGEDTQALRDKATKLGCKPAYVISKCDSTTRWGTYTLIMGLVE